MSLETSASQTVGPYLHIGLNWLTIADLTGPGIAGQPITLAGTIFDGDGQPVPDAMVEIWQANSHGRYPHPEDQRNLPLEPNFLGFGRVPTDAQGGFRFTTIKPGPVPGPGGQLQAPHINVTIFMRGMLRHLVTRVYFPDDPANAGDAVMGTIPAERRGTLVARKSGSGGTELTWNVVLQGQDETVFFDA